MRLRSDYPWIPEPLRNFRVEVPEKFNWGFDVVDRRANTRDKLALVYTDDDGVVERYTFSEISAWSNRLANLVSSHGVGKGDPFFVMLGNVPVLWALIVALIKVGAIIVPLATQLTRSDVEYRAARSGVKGVVTSAEHAQKFEGVAGRTAFRGVLGERPGWVSLDEARKESNIFVPEAETRADEPALLYFTSGTEGPPKMVVHTHASYPLGHLATALWLGLREEDLHWNISSPGWAKHAWSSVFAPWGVGAATFAYNYRGPFDPKRHLEKIGAFRVNTICAPPTIWRLFILQDLSKYDFSSLREAASAGEPLNPEVIERFRRHTGITIRDGYGQTETVVQVANFPGIRVKPGSMGVPCPLYDVDIVDDEGNVLPPGVEGNIAIRVEPQRPFALLKEYLGDSERNAEAFRNGWYYTGDRAYKDEEGYFWYVGRADDVIKSAAYRIGPFEVESALIEHPAVAESAAVASPDELRGAVVKAYVVLKPGWKPSQELADELARFVAQKTAPYKHPRRIEFVTTLDPVKTISGKIRRAVLRAQEYGGERVVRGVEYSVRPLREEAAT